jgi:hypothetical protein
MEHHDLVDRDNPYAAPKIQEWQMRPVPEATVGIDLAVENPFWTIWMRPRDTIRGIVKTNRNHHVIPLAIGGGIVQTLDQAASRNAGDQLSLSAILAIAIVAGPIAGLVGLYFWGWLLGLAGRWIGGHAENDEVRAAVAWAMVPVIATIPLLAIQVGFLGHEVFTTQTPYLDSRPELGLVLAATGILEVILGIWSFVASLKCVGEVQGFSAWKALGSMFVAALLIVIPLILLFIFLLSTRR